MVFIEYLKSHRDVSELYMKTSDEIVWKSLSNFCNTLCIARTNRLDQNEVAETRLPEDIELCGFTPLNHLVSTSVEQNLASQHIEPTAEFSFSVRAARIKMAISTMIVDVR